MVTRSTKFMSVGIATVLHFLVDGLCVCCLYLMAGTALPDILPLFLTYNILAFMTQPLTGLFVDRLRRKQAALLISNGLFASAVALLVGAALVEGLTGVWAMAVAVMLGLGNSLFHVWGGRLTAVVSNSDLRALGVFVSSGVLGLTVSVLYASWWLMAAMLLLLVLLGTFFLFPKVVPDEVRSPLSVSGEGNGRLWLLLPAVLAFVLMRSFVGEVATEDLDGSRWVLLFLAFAAMVGKAAGGWLARWWGIGPAIVTCVGFVAFCLIWGEEDCDATYVAAFLGVLAINCTMPMTLHLSNRLLPGREGLSFGLLAAMLLPGSWLAGNMYLSSVQYFMLCALLLTISIELGMLLLMGEKRMDVLMGAVAVNILTNVPLNYFLLTYGNSVGRLLAGELLVMLLEALWYYIFVRQWRKAAVYSLLCNAASFLCGILIQFIINY